MEYAKKMRIEKKQYLCGINNLMIKSIENKGITATGRAYA
jgi:hypothetical protein